MTLRPTLFSSRSMSLLMLAALAGVAIWLFVPWGGTEGGQVSDGSDVMPSSVKVDGKVEVRTEGNVVTGLVVPLALRGSEPIALTNASGKMRAETLLGDTAAAAVPAKYTVTWLQSDGDNVLEQGEKAQLSVDLPAESSIHPDNPLRLVIKPVSGDPLIIYDVLGR